MGATVRAIVAIRVVIWLLLCVAISYFVWYRLYINSWSPVALAVVFALFTDLALSGESTYVGEMNIASVKKDSSLENMELRRLAMVINGGIYILIILMLFGVLEFYD